MFSYKDDVLSRNHSRFCDFVDRIYPIELEIKDTTDTDRSASYLDLHLEINSEGWSKCMEASKLKALHSLKIVDTEEENLIYFKTSYNHNYFSTYY